MEKRPEYKGTFQDLCVDQVRRGNSYASGFLKDGKSALALALERAKRIGLPTEVIHRAEERGMLDGSFEMTYEGAERIYKHIREIASRGSGTAKADYLPFIDSLDPVADHDLIATTIFCLDPEVRKKVGNKIENLYRVVLNVGASKRHGYALPLKERTTTNGNSALIPASLEKLLGAIPKVETTEDEEYQRMLKVLVQKKVEREVFPAFKQNEKAAFDLIERRIGKEKNANILEAYQQLRATYMGYKEVQVPGVNPDFRDPQTGEKGVLPSLHQRIGLYHLMREKKFGIFDGCGTGKTAIAALAQTLIESQLKAEGKDFVRTVVMGPNQAKKAWKKGLAGERHERYFAEPQDIAVVNGEKKTPEFIESLRGKKWIVLNNEQLTTKVEGTDKLFVDALVEMGVDYVIADEAHHFKGHNTSTTNGKPTQSAAARTLAHSASHLALLTGTPIPDSLKDYAVMYHLLNPAACPDPTKFDELYQNNPRILYTFFNEKTIRRTSKDLNDQLECEPEEELVELDPVQRKVYQHIVEHRPGNWIIQAQKALLDPRMVDPEVLKRADALGQVTLANSAKYRRLEEMVTADDGPIARGEKFVIFSSAFRDGVTQAESEKLKQRYKEMGLEEAYASLQAHNSIGASLREAIKRKFGKESDIGIIDGTILEVEDREKTIDRLDKDLDGIICTTDTGGESLNFTRANWGFVLDDDYSPNTDEQLVARLVRKGQTRKVNLRYLRGKDTLDENKRDYVRKKDIVNRIAIDGYPLTRDEHELLEDTEGKKFGEIIKRGLGGVSINVLDASIEDTSDFEVKKRSSYGSRASHGSEISYDTTKAQEVMQRIGKDPVNCWKDPEFVKLYMEALNNLAVPVIHRAKITDLIGRADRDELAFPKKVLSEGSGPSLLYSAYQHLAPVVNAHGYKVPAVWDRDFSKAMLAQGTNPHQVLGNMTGEKSIFDDKTFDMVDNESITLLRNPDEVKDSLTEANRILKPKGLLEVLIKNKKFSDGFNGALEGLGFKVLNEKNEGLYVSKPFMKRLRQEHGEHFAESYAAKLANTQFIVAQKEAKPGQVKASDLWFDNIGVSEEEQAKRESVIKYRTPSESRSIIAPRSRRKGAKPSAHTKFDADREVVVDKSGIVQSIKKLRGNQ